MLVLARRIGEEIVIDGRIVVKVLGVRRNAVRLGIKAPVGVLVDRDEVHDRRRREQAAVAALFPAEDTASVAASRPAAQRR